MAIGDLVKAILAEAGLTCVAWPDLPGQLARQDAPALGWFLFPPAGRRTPAGWSADLEVTAFSRGSEDLPLEAALWRVVEVLTPAAFARQGLEVELGPLERRPIYQDGRLRRGAVRLQIRVAP